MHHDLDRQSRQLDKQIRNGRGVNLSSYTVAELRKLASYCSIQIGRYDSKTTVVEKLTAYYVGDHRGYRSTHRYSQH